MRPETLDIVLALVISIVLHEVAHGLVARLLGDKTAQNAGRLTLNPLKHIDPQGSILVPLILAAGQMATIGRVEFMYGWARPVPVNAMELRVRGERHPRQLMAVVAAAGPLTNFALAILGAALFYTRISPVFLSYFIFINLTIGFFNLLPIPPFDGGRIAVGVLPLKVARFVARGEKFGIVAVLLLLFVLPAALGHVGIAFNPVQSGLARILPWGMHAVLWVTGQHHGI